MKFFVHFIERYSTPSYQRRDGGTLKDGWKSKSTKMRMLYQKQKKRRISSPSIDARKLAAIKLPYILYTATAAEVVFMRDAEGKTVMILSNATSAPTSKLLCSSNRKIPVSWVHNSSVATSSPSSRFLRHSKKNFTNLGVFVLHLLQKGRGIP